MTNSPEVPARPYRAAGAPQRIAALDFTKGALVLLMVLYHWLNYFVSVEGAYYKYLRFLTPSFIFITGFLVSHVYLRKYELTDPRLPRRLLVRGLKLVGIFLGLNVLIQVLLGGGMETSLTQWMTYLTGSSFSAAVTRGRASFFVLLPIGYVLVLAAGLVMVARRGKQVFHVASLLSVVGVVALSTGGSQNAYLELVSIGLVGISAGCVSADWLCRLNRSGVALAGLYAAYLVAISIWHEVYLMQITGVCLTLAVVYLIGARPEGPAWLRNATVLLGRYSLFAYILHIVILQALRTATRGSDSGPVLTSLFLPTAALVTVFSVMAVDRARARTQAVNKLYAAVFA